MKENKEATEIKLQFKHHIYICPCCGSDYDPNWLLCQRCACDSFPVKKEDKKE
jgi:hypothetical protein